MTDGESREPLPRPAEVRVPIAAPPRRPPEQPPEDAGSGSCPGSSPDRDPPPDLASEEEEEQVPYPALAPTAFFCLKQTTRPRSWCLRLVCNPWFEHVSMLVILLNCVTLGMFQPCEDVECQSERCTILEDPAVKALPTGMFFPMQSLSSEETCCHGPRWVQNCLQMPGIAEFIIKPSFNLKRGSVKCRARKPDELGSQ